MTWKRRKQRQRLRLQLQMWPRMEVSLLAALAVSCDCAFLCSHLDCPPPNIELTSIKSIKSIKSIIPLEYLDISFYGSQLKCAENQLPGEEDRERSRSREAKKGTKIFLWVLNVLLLRIGWGWLLAWKDRSLKKRQTWAAYVWYIKKKH